MRCIVDTMERISMMLKTFRTGLWIVLNCKMSDTVNVDEYGRVCGDVILREKTSMIPWYIDFGKADITVSSPTITSMYDMRLPMVIDGSLTIVNCSELREIAGRTTKVNGNLIIRKCPKLTNMYDTPKVGKNITISQCDALDNLCGISNTLNGDLNVIENKGLRSFKGFSRYIKGSLVVEGCKNITNLNNKPAFVGGNFVFINNGKNVTKYLVSRQCRIGRKIITHKYECKD